jgi:microcin C transport system substrate-binding protein
MGRMVKSFLAAWLVALTSVHLTAHAEHAIAMYDKPKYPAGFTHFDYVNPDAPKGGTLYLANPDRRSSFDKFNPFTLKGVAAAGVLTLMFETLATSSADEVATIYGLLADDIVLAPDRRSITFHINSKARFNNGDAVTAADVKYSFDTLMDKGAPQFKSIFGDIAKVVVINAATVRFEFKSDNHELPLLAGSVPIFSKKWAEGTPFDQIQLTPPVASGPYLIEKYDVGRAITFKRNPDYWGNDIPTRKGMFNFGRIAYRFYKDDVARLEAFKAGEFDVSVEYIAKNWVRSYVGKQFDNGNIIKRELAHMNGAGMQGFIMNMRRDQFKDARVRQALILALDYEWLNRQLFYNQYKRIDSYFANTTLAAKGLPEGEELALLTSLKQQGFHVTPEMFGPAPLQPVTTEPDSLRGNLLKARALLKEAGWEYRDGALRNAQGKIFSFEILDDSSSMTRVISVYIRNLEKLGIQVTQRSADYALVAKRMDSFDFDMTSMRFADTSVPGNELTDVYGSAAADTQGSNNVWGLKDPLVDKIITQILAAKQWDTLAGAARALDRVLLNKYMVIPQWYSSTHRVAYRNRFGMPDVLPLYYQADPYVISTWWEKAPS